MDVQQGPSAVAGIDGRIGLDKIVEYSIICSNTPVNRTDDTGGDRMRKTERVTDGDDGFEFGWNPKVELSKTIISL